MEISIWMLFACLWKGLFEIFYAYNTHWWTTTFYKTVICVKSVFQKKERKIISDLSQKTIEKNSKPNFIESETLGNDKEILSFYDVKLINISANQSIEKTKFKWKVLENNSLE